MKIGRGQINAMRLRIERHRPRAPFCLQRLHDAQFLRRFFFQNIRHTFTAGGKDKLRRIIEGRAIHARANRRGPDDFARLRIEHRHHLVVTGGENPMMRGVKRDPARFFTGRERPMRHHFVFGGIDRGHFALVFDVDSKRGRPRNRPRQIPARPRAKLWRQLSTSWRRSR